MAKRTRKVGVAGKFGPRYGVKARRIYTEVVNKKNKKYECPNCGYRSVSRRDTGIWKCRHCDHTFAGGAYVPQTRIVGKIYSAESGSKYEDLKKKLQENEALEAQARAEDEEVE